MSAVFAGIGGDIIRKFSDLLFKGLDKLMEIGLKVDDIEDGEDSDTGTSYTTFKIHTGGGHVLEVRADKLSNNKYTVVIQETDGKHRTYKKEKIDESKLDDLFTDIIDEWYGESYEGMEDVMDSIQISMHKSLHSSQKYPKLAISKVNCSTGTAGIAAKAISELCADSDFIDSLDTQDSTYEIVPTESEINVIELEGDIDNVGCNYLEIIMSYIMNLLDDLYTVRWNIDTNQSSLCAVVEDIRWTCVNNLNLLASLCIECNGYVSDCKTLHCQDSIIDTKHMITSEEGSDLLIEDIDELLSVIEMFKCNMEDDIQQVMNTFIRDYKRIKCVQLKRI